jgi:hypothetical protein
MEKYAIEPGRISLGSNISDRTLCGSRFSYSLEPNLSFVFVQKFSQRETALRHKYRLRTDWRKSQEGVDLLLR